MGGQPQQTRTNGKADFPQHILVLPYARSLMTMRTSMILKMELCDDAPRLSLRSSDVGANGIGGDAASRRRVHQSYTPSSSPTTDKMSRCQRETDLVAVPALSALPPPQRLWPLAPRFRPQSDCADDLGLLARLGNLTAAVRGSQPYNLVICPAILLPFFHFWSLNPPIHQTHEEHRI